MSPHGLRKRSAKPCNQYAEESSLVLSLKSRQQKPPNPLLIQDKAFYSLLWDWLTGNRSDERVFEPEATPRPVIPNDEPCYQVPSGSPLPRGRMYTGIPPTYPGIYRITEIDYDGPHYIGCTINLLRRYKEHKRNGLIDETKEFRYAKVKDEFFQFYKDNLKALMELIYKIEQAQIEKHQPRKNKHRGGNGKPPKREIHG